jgi:hypothetical protein
MDEDKVTPADLAEAQKRWADPSHVPSVPDIFSRPECGNGVRGDVPIKSEAAAGGKSR